MTWEWESAKAAQEYGATLLEGELVRFRALEDADLPDLVRWWRDPEWAVLQQLVVRPRPSESVSGMFRSWSTSDRSGDVGFSVVDRTSGTLVGHVTLRSSRSAPQPSP